MALGNFNGYAVEMREILCGIGEYQNSKPYANNGVRRKNHPSREYIVGKTVSYTGTHKDFYHSQGAIVSKKGDFHRSGRSLIKVLLKDGRTTYFHKDSLVFL